MMFANSIVSLEASASGVIRVVTAISRQAREDLRGIKQIARGMKLTWTKTFNRSMSSFATASSTKRRILTLQ